MSLIKHALPCSTSHKDALPHIVQPFTNIVDSCIFERTYIFQHVEIVGSNSIPKGGKVSASKVLIVIERNAQ